MKLETALFKLKKNKVDTWKAWLYELDTTYAEEVKETLKEEGLAMEFWKVFEHDGVFYTLGGGYRVSDGNVSDREVNRLHKEKKVECFDFKVVDN